MSIRRAPAIAAVCGLAVALPAAGQSIPWLNPVNGNWSEAAKWTGGNIPDAPGEVGRLNVAGTYTVTQNVGGLSLSAINIATTTATLNLVGNSVTLSGVNGLTNSGMVINSSGNSVITGALNNNATGLIGINTNTAITLVGALTNNGDVVVNTTGNNSFGTTLIAGSAVVIGGNGSILLNGNGGTGHMAGPGSFENGASHTIHGRGQISAALTNQGLVQADQVGQTLSLISSPMTNNGTMRANNDATLSISGIAVTQGASGVIEADDGSVNLTGAGISGGTLRTFNDGFLGNVGGTSTLTDVTNEGNLFVNTNTAISLAGSMLNNEGTVVVNTTGNNSFTTTLNAATSVLIDGPGDIFLNGNASAGQLTNSVGAVITNGASHTIHGRGQITAEMVNNGLVDADVAGNTLTLNTSNKANNAMMLASNTSNLAITGITINQSPGAVVSADGGFVNLTSAGINGGEIEGVNGGRFRGVSGNQTLTDVNLTGLLDVFTNTSITLAGGAFTNNGSVLVNDQGNNSFTTTLNMSGDVVIDGAGEIILNGNSGAGQITGNTLTLGADQVIRGRGQITAPMINNGLVHANVASNAIALNTTGKQNNAEMRASNSGLLQVSAITITQAPGAVVSADNGFVDLSSAGISGGEIEGINGGRIRGVLGNQTLTDVNLTGLLNVNTNTAITLAGGAFTNNGSVLVNDQGNSSFTTTLAMGGDVAIDGTGEIVLNANGGAAQITGNTLTLGANQVVHGRGQIVAPMTNNGLVEANVDGTGIALNTAAKQNNATMRATNNAVLAINGITVNQSSGGVLSADGGFIDLSSGGISGGTIEGVNGGRIRGVLGNQTLTDVNLTGLLNVNTNTAVTLAGGAFTNNGSVLVNDQGNNSFVTTLSMSGDVVVDGTGEIVLNANSGAAQLTGGTLTLGSGQTLRGVGNIVCPLVMEGTMAPGRSVGSLNVPVAGNIVTYQPGSTFAAELSSAAAYDRVTGGSHTINGGTVEVTLLDDYAPTLFTKHTIIDGSGASVVTGKFDGINGPALPPPLVWKIGYSAQDVVIGVTCPSDTNADFIVDFLDFLDFFDEFASCENQPAPCGNLFNSDYNGDTFVDILDFLDFLDAFGGGC